MELLEHQLMKTFGKQWRCEICKWTWDSKPKTECPGVVRYDWLCWPKHLLTPSDLEKRNLKPKKGTNPVGGYYSRKGNFWLWLYEETDCEINDPSLPEIVSWDDKEKRGLLTTRELRKQNLAPNGEPNAVAWIWDSEEERGKWIPLYLANNCKWQAKDEYISKSVLKQKYLLSDSWIKRLGEPNRKVENPRSFSHPINLYSRQRVEKFLADNAEEYAQWLNKRDKYLAIFEQHRDKIVEGQTRHREQQAAIKEQTAKCLRCASGCGTSQGFLCAIYPMGVPRIPCPDWQERNKELSGIGCRH